MRVASILDPTKTVGIPVTVLAPLKNLWHAPQEQTADGISCTVASDGGIRLKGVSTLPEGISNRTDFYPLSDGQKIALPAGEYTLSCKDDMTGIILFCIMSVDDQPDRYMIIPTSNGNAKTLTFTLPEHASVTPVVGVQGGATIDLTVHPMLEDGDTAHDYIPYQ
ncbi:hypothetical protein [Bifidobacterium callitrichos]|uniref:Uncharacterized protein n=1 Tax=Bifidobacterium callitrichos DSM 23973 TaxID=1437609 RepID=A0A087ACT9_9BIFI|nr:hypothetical protein [Bifidobacterium callitrichos]KFI56589.1 hypothetical protein BCAL_0187 [Bifidobacterium callitrichos DSM 23973]